MIKGAKMSFEEQVSFDPRPMQQEIPLDVSWRANTATDKLHSAFEDYRVRGEQTTPRVDWPFLTFWVSYAAGIVFIVGWALS
jgi:hypothetical protein